MTIGALGLPVCSGVLPGRGGGSWSVTIGGLGLPVGGAALKTGGPFTAGSALTGSDALLVLLASVPADLTGPGSCWPLTTDLRV